MGVGLLYDSSRFRYNDRRNYILTLIILIVSRLFVISKRSKILLAALFSFIILYTIYQFNNGPKIIFITPTYKRPERLAEMTRLSQTLMHLRNIYWIVVEDSTHTVNAVDRLLERSGIPYVYFPAKTKPGFPGMFTSSILTLMFLLIELQYSLEKGWTQRNVALEYVRTHFKNYKGGVVYFADDDNSYDLRLFDKYIRKVKDIGIWGVGNTVINNYNKII